jgi:hypothetical protein
MPKRISKDARPMDLNQAALLMVERSTAEPEPTPKRKSSNVKKSEISRVMAAMGRKGGKIGGKRRMETMTPEERSQVALKAAKARWDPKKKGAAATARPQS